MRSATRSHTTGGGPTPARLSSALLVLVGLLAATLSCSADEEPRVRSEAPPADQGNETTSSSPPERDGAGLDTPPPDQQESRARHATVWLDGPQSLADVEAFTSSLGWTPVELVGTYHATDPPITVGVIIDDAPLDELEDEVRTRVLRSLRQHLGQQRNAGNDEDGGDVERAIAEVEELGPTVTRMRIAVPNPDDARAAASDPLVRGVQTGTLCHGECGPPDVDAARG